MNLRSTLLTLPVVTILSAGLGILSACSQQPRYDSPPVVGNEVVIDISSLPLEDPKFYTLRIRNRNVSFFLLKLNNGVFAFFDACVSCYPQKRGYACKDGYVTCRACNMRFSIYKLEKGLGGCFPIKIDGKLAGTSYHIPMATIEENANKF